MARWFNVAGPCRPDIHYMLPATERLPEVMRLIDQQSYFVLHAPRQSGKTTAMLELGRLLTVSGRYAAVIVSAEVGAPFSDDPGQAENAILDSWRDDAEHQLPPDLQPPVWPNAAPGRRIGAALRAWSQTCQRPLVVFLDEIDALENDALISVLRQLRDGYRRRPTDFPWALALIGLRDVRDYKVAAGGSERLTTASPFNIKARSLTLGNFSAADVEALYQQHTTATGQLFTPAALAHAFTLTQGQPWLVNALAKVAVEELMLDRSQAITDVIIDQAKAVIIARQETHLDSLADRLREPRIRAVIEPLLAGTIPSDLPVDDIRFVQDLGLVRMDPAQGLVIANPIYEAVIPRSLTTTTRAFLPALRPTWLTLDGRLDRNALLTAFLHFWREHGQPLLGTTPYHEIAPQLVLQAFLDRVANGGGQVQRESMVGIDRVDLLLSYRGERLPIELKVWRDGRADPREEGVAQLDGYLAGLSLDTGWLVVFDQRRGQPAIAERTRADEVTAPSGRVITVIRA
ncbi:MAG: hypothetical protein RLZZ387_1372 [Chloroflexota bacterium]|jgi:type II secretory pathway predicted ATPase ExeA